MLEQSFRESLLNTSALFGFQVFQHGLIWADAQLKTGYDLYFVSNGFTSGGISINPGLKIGFYGLFMDLCYPITLGFEKPLSMFQIGVGWRFRLGKEGAR